MDRKGAKPKADTDKSRPRDRYDDSDNSSIHDSDLDLWCFGKLVRTKRRAKAKKQQEAAQKSAVEVSKVDKESQTYLASINRRTIEYEEMPGAIYRTAPVEPKPEASLADKEKPQDAAISKGKIDDECKPPAKVEPDKDCRFLSKATSDQVVDQKPSEGVVSTKSETASKTQPFDVDSEEYKKELEQPVSAASSKTNFERDKEEEKVKAGELKRKEIEESSKVSTIAPSRSEIESYSNLDLGENDKITQTESKDDVPRRSTWAAIMAIPRRTFASVFGRRDSSVHENKPKVASQKPIEDVNSKNPVKLASDADLKPEAEVEKKPSTAFYSGKSEFGLKTQSAVGRPEEDEKHKIAKEKPLQATNDEKSVKSDKPTRRSFGKKPKTEEVPTDEKPEKDKELANDEKPVKSEKPTRRSLSSILSFKKEPKPDTKAEKDTEEVKTKKRSFGSIFSISKKESPVASKPSDKPPDVSKSDQKAFEPAVPSIREEPVEPAIQEGTAKKSTSPEDDIKDTKGSLKPWVRSQPKDVTPAVQAEENKTKQFPDRGDSAEPKKAGNARPPFGLTSAAKPEESKTSTSVREDSAPTAVRKEEKVAEQQAEAARQPFGMISEPGPSQTNSVASQTYFPMIDPSPTAVTQEPAPKQEKSAPVAQAPQAAVLPSAATKPEQQPAADKKWQGLVSQVQAKGPSITKRIEEEKEKESKQIEEEKEKDSKQMPTLQAEVAGTKSTQAAQEPLKEEVISETCCCIEEKLALTKDQSLPPAAEANEKVDPKNGAAAAKEPVIKPKEQVPVVEKQSLSPSDTRPELELIFLPSTIKQEPISEPPKKEIQTAEKKASSPSMAPSLSPTAKSTSRASVSDTKAQETKAPAGTVIKQEPDSEPAKTKIKTDKKRTSSQSRASLSDSKTQQAKAPSATVIKQEQSLKPLPMEDGKPPQKSVSQPITPQIEALKADDSSTPKPVKPENAKVVESQPSVVKEKQPLSEGNERSGSPLLKASQQQITPSEKSSKPLTVHEKQPLSASKSQAALPQGEASSPIGQATIKKEPLTEPNRQDAKKNMQCTAPCSYGVPMGTQPPSSPSAAQSSPQPDNALKSAAPVTNTALGSGIKQEPQSENDSKLPKGDEKQTSTPSAATKQEPLSNIKQEPLSAYDNQSKSPVPQQPQTHKTQEVVPGSQISTAYQSKKETDSKPLIMDGKVVKQETLPEKAPVQTYQKEFIEKSSHALTEGSPTTSDATPKSTTPTTPGSETENLSDVKPSTTTKVAVKQEESETLSNAKPETSGVKQTTPPKSETKGAVKQAESRNLSDGKSEIPSTDKNLQTEPYDESEQPLYLHEQRSFGIQTVPDRFPLYASSEKMLVPTGGAIKSNPTSKHVQTDCVCNNDSSIERMNAIERMRAARTGSKKQNKAVQTDLCMCNYVSSSSTEEE